MLGCGLLILCGIQFVGVVVCSLIVLIFVSILCRGNCLRLVWVLVARDLLFFGVFGVVGLLWDSLWLCLLIRLLCSCGVPLDDCLLFGVYDGDLVWLVLDLMSLLARVFRLFVSIVFF